jgi:hypothetical protein
MSVFSNALALVGLLGICLIVSCEVRALVTALHFAVGTKYQGRERRKLILLRYEFTSVMLHQRFATRRRQKPAYSTWGASMMGMLTLSVGLVAGYDASRLGQLLGCAFLVGGAYFAVRYGRAFVKQREVIERVNAKGNPLSFSA